MSADIQKQIEKKKKEAEKISKEIAELEQKQIQESEKPENAEWVDLPGTDYEITKNVLYKGKSYNQIMKLKKPEEELLTLKMVGVVCENPKLLKELKMDASSTKDDFFFKQPFPQNEQRGYVAGFGWDSDYSYLNCWMDSVSSYSSLGVRFCRKKISKG